MRVGGLGRIAQAVARRPVLVLAVTAVLALTGGALALRLEPSAGITTLVDPDSPTFAATERYERDFGGEAVIVLVQGGLSELLLGDDLGRLRGLEDCLAGRAHKQQPRVCGELAAERAVRVVYGPSAFLDSAANQFAQEYRDQREATRKEAEAAGRRARAHSRRQGDPKYIQDELADAASAEVIAEFQAEVEAIAERYGLLEVPRPGSPSFISGFLFDTQQPEIPRPQFSHLSRPETRH